MKKSIGLITFCLFTYLSFSQNDVWNQKAGIPAEGRHRTSGWSIGNKGYMGLGHYNSGFLGNVAKADIWEYDPASDSWTQKADYPIPTYGAVSFTIDNKAYVGAHVYGQNEFFEFDPIANSWTAISPVPNGGSDQCAFSANGKGYFVGSSHLYEYDPNSGSWTQKTAAPTSVWSWSKAFSIDDKGYVLSTSGAFYEYKPLTDQWSLRAPFPGEAIGGWSVFSAYDKGYVVSGYIQFLNPTSKQTWEYDPSTNTWEQLEDLPGMSRRFSSSFSIGNKGYIGTGTNGTNLKDFWEFDRVLSATPLGKPELSIYPCPATEFIQIEGLAMDSDIRIFSLSGQLIFEQKNLESTIQLLKEDFGKGTFIYHIRSEETGIYTGKITFI